MRTPPSWTAPFFVAAGAAAVLSLAFGSPAHSAAKLHQCGNGSKTQQLYPWVSGVHGVSTGKACSVVVALGRSVSGEKFPSLESLVTCSPAPVDASGAQTGPGVATLKQTSFHGWALSYSSNSGLRLAKGSAAFHAGQQDFGCF